MDILLFLLIGSILAKQDIKINYKVLGLFVIFLFVFVILFFP